MFDREHFGEFRAPVPLETFVLEQPQLGTLQLRHVTKLDRTCRRLFELWEVRLRHCFRLFEVIVFLLGFRRVF